MELYFADLVYATRTPTTLSEGPGSWIEIDTGPRASIALDKYSRTHAWLADRDYIDLLDGSERFHW